MTYDPNRMTKHGFPFAAGATNTTTGSPMASPSPSSNSESKDEFGFPDAESRRKEIRMSVEELRARIAKDREEGRKRGEDLFGEGSLGRLSESSTLQSALNQAQGLGSQVQGALGGVPSAQINPLQGTDRIQSLQGIQGTDTSRLTQAAGTAEGFGADARQSELDQREMATRRLNQATQTAMRAQRGASSARGLTGATAAAREGDVLKSALQSRADLETTLSRDVLDRKEREAGLKLNQRQLGVAAEGTAAQIESQTNLARGQQDLNQRGQDVTQRAQDLNQSLASRGQDIGATLEQRSQDIGFQTQSADILNRALATQSQLTTQIAEMQQARESFNLGQAGSEKQQQLQTELANVGLAAAIESGGASTALSSLQQDMSIEFGKKSLENETLAINKPAPEAPDAGMSFLCSLCHERGDLSDMEYLSDNLMMDSHGRDAYNAYALWAPSVRKFCSERDWAYKLIRIPVKAWGKAMHSKAIGQKVEGFLGKFLDTFGSKICKLIARFK